MPRNACLELDAYVKVQCHLKELIDKLPESVFVEDENATKITTERRLIMNPQSTRTLIANTRAKKLKCLCDKTIDVVRR